MGNEFELEPIKWTAPYAGTPLEPLVLKRLSNKPRGLGNPQETFPCRGQKEGAPQRLYGPGLRCPRYSPASKPVQMGGQGKPDAGS